MKKTAETSVPIHSLLAERWSPRAFDQRPVAKDVLTSLFEAARWAPSCFNDQPWTYLVATSDGDPEGHARFAACLMDGNAWAHAAPVLACAVARDAFAHNDKPNAHAAHDVGLASMSLVVQAQAHDLYVHQMAGFHADKAREALAIPEGHRPIAFLALGYRGDADALPEQIAEREKAARARKPLEDVLRGSSWRDAFGG